MRQKKLYEAPETEVLELRLEGVIAMSGDGNNTESIPEEGGDWGFGA